MGDVTIDRRRFLLGAVAGVVGTAVFGACGGSGGLADQAAPPPDDLGSGGPAQRRRLRLPDGALGFPSPFAANGGPGYNQMILLYDTLLWRDGTGDLLPWLATAHEVSPDRLTHTFRLRDGVTWSDGHPFTADDVVFTFDYYAGQGTLSPPVIVQPPQGVAKVVATGPATVEVTLEQPVVTFAGQVAGAMPMIPRHVWSSVKDPGAAQERRVLVGTGPYRLASYKGDGAPMLFEARDDYFLGAPFVRRIEMNAIEDPFPALLSGAADSAQGFGLRDDTLAPFRGPEYGTITDDGSFLHALYFNLTRETALSDVRFRKACAMAIDRDDLVARLAAGKGLPGNPGFLSPRNPWSAPVQQYGHDPAGANALLDGAGYQRGADGTRRHPDGTPLTFELRFDGEQVAMGETLVAALRTIGVQLRKKPVQVGPELFGAKYVGNFDLVVLPYPGPSPGGPNSDPDVLRLVFSSAGGSSLTSAAHWSNRRFEELAAAQLVAAGDAERRAMVAEMQALIADEVPILPLLYPTNFVVYRRRVLDQWYFTPGEYPTVEHNKQLYVTGLKAGSEIRPVV